MKNVFIIGKGPAGLTAGIYTARAGLKTIIMGKDSKMNNPHSYENYFGFPEGITGKDLLEKGEKHAKKFKAEIIEGTVVSVKKKDKIFNIETDKKEFTADAIIIATGMPVKNSGIKNEKDYSGKGVSYCVACDGFFFKNKKIAVIGSGDFAAHEAIELLNYTKNIEIFTQNEKLSVSKDFLKKLKNNNIKIREEKIDEIKGKQLVEKLLINGKEEDFQGVFIAVGLADSSDFARKLGINVKDNFIQIDRNCFTGVEGIFSAGDCTGLPLQVTKAVGEGAVAGKSAVDYLSE